MRTAPKNRHAVALSAGLSLIISNLFATNCGQQTKFYPFKLRVQAAQNHVQVLIRENTKCISTVPFCCLIYHLEPFVALYLECDPNHFVPDYRRPSFVLYLKGDLSLARSRSLLSTPFLTKTRFPKLNLGCIFWPLWLFLLRS